MEFVAGSEPLEYLWDELCVLETMAGDLGAQLTPGEPLVFGGRNDQVFWLYRSCQWVGEPMPARHTVSPDASLRARIWELAGEYNKLKTLWDARMNVRHEATEVDSDAEEPREEKRRRVHK